jgi:hypothetical protein
MFDPRSVVKGLVEIADLQRGSSRLSKSGVVIRECLSARREVLVSPQERWV